MVDITILDKTILLGDSKEGLKMESSRQKETGKAKNDPGKNL